MRQSKREHVVVVTRLERYVGACQSQAGDVLNCLAVTSLYWAHGYNIAVSYFVMHPFGSRLYCHSCCLVIA